MVKGLLRRLIAENAHKAMNQEEYTRRETALQERYEEAQQEIASLEKQCIAQKVRGEQLSALLDGIEKQRDFLNEFDEHLWWMTVESVTIHSRERMIFRFKGGVRI